MVKRSCQGCDSFGFFWIYGVFVTNFRNFSVKIKQFLLIFSLLRKYFSQFHAFSGFLSRCQSHPCHAYLACIEKKLLGSIVTDNTTD